MKTIADVVKLSTVFLSQKGISQPRRQAEELVSSALNLDRTELYMRFDCPLVESELQLCRDYLHRRGKGEPIPYIRGSVDFLGCTISVNPNVLIPRQETEILTDKIAKILSKQQLEGKQLWDICCGSGCIGIALKKKFPQLKVTASDISPQALQVARNNACANQVELRFLEGDLFAPFGDEKANYVVCNPPYVKESEIAGLDIEVRNYEPALALKAGPTGLEFYHRLGQTLPNYLTKPGMVWLEIGSEQGTEVKNIFKQYPWAKTWVEQDWARHDRFFFIEME